MTHDELISLAKSASTPDTQYIVEISQSPDRDAKITVRRIVEMTGIETVYSNTDERGAHPLDEGIARMQSEAAAFRRISGAKGRTGGKRHGLDVEALFLFIARYEHMNGYEGPTLGEIAAEFGFASHHGAEYNIDKLVKQHRVWMYRDLITGAKRYKAVNPK